MQTKNLIEVQGPRHNPKDIYRALLVLLIIALFLSFISMLSFDQQLAKVFQKEQLSGFKNYNKQFTDGGLGSIYFFICLIVFIFTKWIGPQINSLKKFEKKLLFYKNWSVNFFYALLFSGFLLHIFKNLIGRQRPYLSPNFDPYIFHPLSFNWDYYSMPSGHSQVVFTAATMFAFAWPKFQTIFFILASILAFSRVVTQAHFFSDVLLGSYLGFAGAMLTIIWAKRKKNYSN